MPSKQPAGTRASSDSSVRRLVPHCDKPISPPPASHARFPKPASHRSRIPLGSVRKSSEKSRRIPYSAPSTALCAKPADRANEMKVSFFQYIAISPYLLCKIINTNRLFGKIVTVYSTGYFGFFRFIRQKYHKKHPNHTKKAPFFHRSVAPIPFSGICDYCFAESKIFTYLCNVELRTEVDISINIAAAHSICVKLRHYLFEFFKNGPPHFLTSIAVYFRRQRFQTKFP